MSEPILRCDIADRKRELVAKILDNKVYQSDSGAYQQAFQALLRLPLVNLGQIETIIGCK